MGQAIIVWGEIVTTADNEMQITTYTDCYMSYCVIIVIVIFTRLVTFSTTLTFVPTLVLTVLVIVGYYFYVWKGFIFCYDKL